MKKIIAIAAVLSSTWAVPALADWTGPYAGAQASSASGTMIWWNDGELQETTFSLPGEPIGLFAGYNAQFGSYVVGGEVAYSIGKVGITTETDTDLSENYYLDNHIDVKARVGFAQGNALFYGIVGYSTTGYTRPITRGSEEIETNPMSGMSFGAGVDLMVTDSFFVGGEYLSRTMSGDSINTALSMEADVQTISLRAGYKF